MRGAFIWDTCVAVATKTWKLTCMLACPPYKKQQQIAFIMQISSPSICLHNASLDIPAVWLSQRPCSKRKRPRPCGQTQKPPNSCSLKDLVRVSEGASWSDKRFPHHSFKADPVQVLGAVVPQYVGSTVRTGCAPVLDLCHLQRRNAQVKKRRSFWYFNQFMVLTTELRNTLTPKTFLCRKSVNISAAFSVIMKEYDDRKLLSMWKKKSFCKKCPLNTLMVTSLNHYSVVSDLKSLLIEVGVRDF